MRRFTFGKVVQSSTHNLEILKKKISLKCFGKFVKKMKIFVAEPLFVRFSNGEKSGGESVPLLNYAYDICLYESMCLCVPECASGIVGNILS